MYLIYLSLDTITLLHRRTASTEEGAADIVAHHPPGFAITTEDGDVDLSSAILVPLKVKKKGKKHVSSKDKRTANQ